MSKQLAKKYYNFHFTEEENEVKKPKESVHLYTVNMSQRPDSVPVSPAALHCSPVYIIEIGLERRRILASSKVHFPLFPRTCRDGQLGGRIAFTL